ncbi:MAG: transposase [Phycisphaerales bacterium]|nr:transposase [Phycisphaerales bacterium]
MIDNLKAAVTKADWFDPELNPKLQAFAEHCGTVIVPTRPYTPRHKGKVERGVDYVQENALKGRTFDSLADQNRYLAEWEAAVADTRIHGTTRQQVGRVFEQIERPACGRCRPRASRASRKANASSIATATLKSPKPITRRRPSSSAARSGSAGTARSCGSSIRSSSRSRFTPDASLAASPPISGTSRPRSRGGLERGAVWWLRKAQAIGPEAGRWAETLLARGIHALRAVMGLVSLTQRHASGAVEQACASARAHAAWRLRDLRNLLKRQRRPSRSDSSSSPSTR